MMGGGYVRLDARLLAWSALQSFEHSMMGDFPGHKRVEAAVPVINMTTPKTSVDNAFSFATSCTLNAEFAS